MAGLPILNPALEVEMLPCVRWKGWWVGLLITPWCMNLVLLPAAEGAADGVPPGDRVELHLPSGRYPFLRGETAETGTYFGCSLFSPMAEFTDQAGARAAGEAALAAAVALPPTPEPPPAAQPDPSKREFLFGRFRRSRQ